MDIPLSIIVGDNTLTATYHPTVDSVNFYEFHHWTYHHTHLGHIMSNGRLTKREPAAVLVEMMEMALSMFSLTK